jgi:hypothetical protein
MQLVFKKIITSFYVKNALFKIRFEYQIDGLSDYELSRLRDLPNKEKSLAGCKYQDSSNFQGEEKDRHHAELCVVAGRHQIHTAAN